jgi:integrase/recombinase XerD
MAHDDPLTAETPVAQAGAIWLARLERAGLDDDNDFDEDDTDDALLRDEQRRHAAQTIAAYRTAVTLFTRWAARAGRATLGDLRIEDILSYARSLRKRSYDLSERAARTHTDAEPRPRLAPRTIHAYTRPLNGFLALADTSGALNFRVAALQVELRQILPRLPDAVAPNPPDLRRLTVYYDKSKPGEEDRSERLKLIRLRNAALLHMLFSSGARISELLSLDVGDVCRDRRILSQAQVRGKGRRTGTIFVRRAAERALQRYLEARQWPRAREALFISYDRRSAGARLSRVSGWRVVHEAAAAMAGRLELEGKFDEADLLRAPPHPTPSATLSATTC